MASAEEALRSLLTLGSPNPVAALVGNRVYALVLMQGTEYPAIRLQRIATPRSEYRTLDGRADYASPRFQIDAYALVHEDAIAVAQAVYQLLEGFAGTIEGLRIDAIGLDDEDAMLEEGAGPGGSPLYRQRVDAIIYHAE